MTVYRAANCAWQLGGDAALIQTVAQGADRVAYVECHDSRNQPIDVAAILGPGFDVGQDTSTGARAGAATAVRVSRGVRVRRSRAALLSRAGRRVQQRDMRITTIVEPRWVTKVVAFHNPLPSTGRQPEARRHARTWVGRARGWRRYGANLARRSVGARQRRWIWLGDSNTDPAEWARVLGAPHHFGVRPMVACWSHGFGPVKTSSDLFAGSDHVVLTLTTKES